MEAVSSKFVHGEFDEFGSDEVGDILGRVVFAGYNFVHEDLGIFDFKPEFSVKHEGGEVAGLSFASEFTLELGHV